jgi:hypothetical protein
VNGRCESCRFWQENKSGIDGATTFRAQVGDRWGHCEAAPHDDYGPDVQATVVDHEGYNAALHTRPTFGCVLWEAK